MPVLPRGLPSLRAAYASQQPNLAGQLLADPVSATIFVSATHAGGSTICELTFSHGLQARLDGGTAVALTRERGGNLTRRLYPVLVGTSHTVADNMRKPGLGAAEIAPFHAISADVLRRPDDKQNAQIWPHNAGPPCARYCAQNDGSGTPRTWTLMTECDRPLESPSGRPAVLSAGQTLAMSGAIIAALTAHYGVAL